MPCVLSCPLNCEMNLGAQAGLSWSTILNKRSNYQKAFDHFDIKRVAAFDDSKMAALKEDPGVSPAHGPSRYNA